MSTMINTGDILETINMIREENLDIRTVTMGISLLDCCSDDSKRFADLIYDKVTRSAERLVPVCMEIEKEYGIPIINKRVSVTPISIAGGALKPDGFVLAAKALDRAAQTLGINFIGGFGALVQKGMTVGDRNLIEAIPEALASTEMVCSSVNVASTKAGINMDAVKLMGSTVRRAAELTADRDAIGCAKLVVFSNVPEDNPFMAGAFHGVSEPDRVINVGVSGPGVVASAIRRAGDCPLDELADVIKKTAFKITRMGQLTAYEASRRLNAAMLNDAVKKGGTMASSHVGGLSGAFIPVSEDSGMINAVREGSLSIEKLEAMTAVCSVGLDMIAIPGDTPADVICGIIADEIAIGVINGKTTAVRVIPVIGKGVGEDVEFGGLLGHAPIMELNMRSPARFIGRGGRIPAPIHSLRN